MDARSRTVELNGETFHYLEYGTQADPPLLFLHGILRPAVDYQPFLRKLAASRRVIAPDQRGHGRSARAEVYSWEGLARDAAALLSSLELAPVDVVGYSMGAYVAMMLAASNRVSVRSVVAIEGGLTWPDPAGSATFWPIVFGVLTPEGYESPEHLVTLASEAFPRARQDVLREAASRLIERDDGRWDLPDRADLGVLSLAANHPAGYTEILGSVKCPTLVLRAEHSELFPGDAYESIVASMDGAQVGIIPGSGHLFAWENPDGTAAAIARFLDAVR